MRRDAGGERGAVTAELVIATPALLFLLMLVVHVGLWFHAAHVASAAAQEGARAARNLDGTDLDGEDAANRLLDQLGARLVLERDVDVTRGPDEVRAVVTGYGPTVVPGLRLAIRAESVGPIEVFRPAEGE
jgi:Flp pilus assembly protein TadG